jgi:hypothetical protein
VQILRSGEIKKEEKRKIFIGAQPHLHPEQVPHHCEKDNALLQTL